MTKQYLLKELTGKRYVRSLTHEELGIHIRWTKNRANAQLFTKARLLSLKSHLRGKCRPVFYED